MYQSCLILLLTPFIVRFFSFFVAKINALFGVICDVEDGLPMGTVYGLRFGTGVWKLWRF